MGSDLSTYSIFVDGGVEAEEVPLDAIGEVLTRIASEIDPDDLLPGGYGVGKRMTIVIEKEPVPS